MLQRGKGTPQLREWLDRLAPVAQEARAALREVKPSKLALLSGCQREADGAYRLAFFWCDYLVSAEAFIIQRADTGAEVSSFTGSMLLTYLASADGTTPSRRWIGYRELPGGMFYAQAFEGYSGRRLVRELGALTAGGGSDLAAFRRAGEALADGAVAIGDAGYAFTILPRIHLAVVYWEGDDEFPSQTRVLFEDTAAHYMTTDGLAILGSRLVDHILKAARA